MKAVASINKIHSFRSKSTLTDSVSEESQCISLKMAFLVDLAQSYIVLSNMVNLQLFYFITYLFFCISVQEVHRSLEEGVGAGLMEL